MRISFATVVVYAFAFCALLASDAVSADPQSQPATQRQTQLELIDLGRVADLIPEAHAIEAEVSDFAWFEGELYLVNGGWTGPHADPGGVFRVDREAGRLVAELQKTNIETIPFIHVAGDEMMISAFDSDTYPATWWRKRNGKWEGRDFPALWGNYHVGGMLKIDDRTLLATINDNTRTYPALGISTDDGETWQRFPSRPRPVALEGFTHVGGFDFLFEFNGAIYAMGDGTRLPPGPEYRGGFVDPMLARIDVKAGDADLLYGRASDLFEGLPEVGPGTMDRFGRAVAVHNQTLYIEFRNRLWATKQLDGRQKMKAVDLGPETNIRDVIVSDGQLFVLSSWHHDGIQDPHRLWAKGPATTEIYRLNGDHGWVTVARFTFNAHATSFERDPTTRDFYLGMMDDGKHRGRVLRVAGAGLE